MKKVNIKILAVITPTDGEKDRIEFITEGSLTYQGQDLILTYDETTLSGMEGSTTRIEVRGNTIYQYRQGTNQSEMIFEKGKRYQSDYATAYGVFSLETMTKDVQVMHREDKPRIYIRYQMVIKGLTESLNELSIEVL